MIDRRFSWPGALIGLWAANSPRPCWHFRIIAFRLLHTLSHPLWHWNTFAFYTCLLSHFIPARLWVESCPRRLRPCAGLWPCTFCSDLTGASLSSWFLKVAGLSCSTFNAVCQAHTVTMRRPVATNNTGMQQRKGLAEVASTETDLKVQPLQRLCIVYSGKNKRAP